eukprot:3074721-Pyramimonas_sp.AAC.1
MERHAPPRFALEFRKCFPSLLEVAPATFTHRVKTDDVFSMARLDRIYTSLPTADVLDLAPESSTCWPPSDLQKPSDHAP